MTTPLLVPFTHGERGMADLLGGKGANLAEMTRLGLPVPHGFTITTEACRAYLRTGRSPEELDGLVRAAVVGLERSTGRAFGEGDQPLLVSVRSGARFSMPGMMETVLDVGLTDVVVEQLVRRRDPRFVWDCYRRLVEMYGRTVLDAPATLFDAARAEVLTARGVASTAELDAEGLQALVRRHRRALVAEMGQDLPQDPWLQLTSSIDAVFRSWNSPRARLYRSHEGIPDDLGTAVTVMQMVYGNTGPRSGSGVCFSRNPATGDATPYGDYLADAQGEDVVNGSRATVPLARLADLEPTAHRELLSHLSTLEKHYRDLCDVEFTVEDGHLWMLQTRVGKRSPAAAFVMAADMAEEGLISEDEALVRVEGHQLESLLHARFDVPEGTSPLVTGLPASPGAGAGAAVFDSQTAVARRAAGEDVVLFRTETSAEDLDGILASVAVVTAHGGLASHAAVVARGFGRTCVTGVSDLVVDEAAREARTPSGHVVREGDPVSVDGTSGRVYAGALAVRPSPVAGGLATGGTTSSESPSSAGTTDDEVVLRAVRRLLAHADERATVAVRVNAETAPEAAQARTAGATGIGLCRTEHMLLGDRRELVEHVVLGHDADAALARIEALALADFTELLRAMDGLPVVVRLLDPPLHEFLPDPEDLAVEVARLEASGRPVPAALHTRLAATRRWAEANPMLGLRGVRLLTVHPELVDAHVRALVTAAARLAHEGLDPRPEVMVPLVSDVAELAAAREHILEVADQTARDLGSDRPAPRVGVMIELPRAALTAGDLAGLAEFFSFGTNDLTQTTWGMSRDDAQASFLTSYATSGLLPEDPFVTLDQRGVGELVRIAVERGRAARPGLELGVCGEHAGDPASIRFLTGCGVDYVSCSPPRVPVARLEVGRAAVLQQGVTASDSR
ncbi:pyruvate, phosphate dikinase [Phycicoccus sp. 3266]|jgi:pyruvate,orthophosphate dikinase|uniref:pyruvate, phosphate dikinase n=1 Tax=Phycicoccus sp. 3266 TaxID=2817751 RepID=UPI002867ACA2|nr:pyruvate, phosphate dikinase [Phycicoccus sp. 3266]MDR6864812.1 pyruvate,orthophosphate dikinase [Phycicoccus sp. 3266]